MDRGTNLGLPGNQMTVATQRLYRVATPRAVERFEQACKKALALRAQPGLAFGEIRIADAPRAGVYSRGQNVSKREEAL